ncbi:hypothetical protein HCW_08953 (plasmid) [Helicobacter cetorum MIT 00-7128]|uniref:Uncharacterized protein n=1 Tax=Helicobacter cetorum (strain ATCC BAA-429 / MIT 00-7128) TaxID=182217 RepID=I0EQ07_HELC0|nr:hypothetical protein HCW_08953 [Helicobacter cetorum MIT 00-7128]
MIFNIQHVSLELENLEQEIKGNKTSFLHSIKEVIEKSIEKKLSFTKIHSFGYFKILSLTIADFIPNYSGFYP